MSTQDVEPVDTAPGSPLPDSGAPNRARQDATRDAAGLVPRPSSASTSPTWWELDDISPRRQAFNAAVVRIADASGRWLRRHWLLLVNSVLGAFVGLALLVPMLYALGATDVGSRIFRAYHLVCDQIPSHSYFLFGYQLALCSRNLAIYGSLLGGSLAFRYVRDWWPRLAWPLWLLTLLPMALDGGTQLFGWRESNWELRTLTGAIFGLGVCWLLLPALEDAAALTARGRARRALDLPVLHRPPAPRTLAGA